MTPMQCLNWHINSSTSFGHWFSSTLDFYKQIVKSINILKLDLLKYLLCTIQDSKLYNKPISNTLQFT